MWIKPKFWIDVFESTYYGNSGDTKKFLIAGGCFIASYFQKYSLFFTLVRKQIKENKIDKIRKIKNYF